MKLTVLIENENGSENRQVKASHGLSFYIEIDGTKILIDLGKSSLFNKNAKLLGLDLSEVDTSAYFTWFILITEGDYLLFLNK